MDAKNGFWIAAVWIAASGGCGQPIDIIHATAPRDGLPAEVRRLAIGAFQADEARWATSAAEGLAARLTQQQADPPRFGVVPAAGADAVITGRVEVRSRRRRDFGPRAPAGAGAKPRARDYLSCDVAVAFAVSAADGTTLLSRRIARRADLLDAPPSESVGDAAMVLIDQCVRAFVAGLLPTRTVTRAHLKRSKSPAIAEGNRLAAAGRHAEALAAYEKALAERPDDPAALANAAVLAEVLGRLDRAEPYYRRAHAVTGLGEYLAAARRVHALSLGEAATSKPAAREANP